MSAAKKIESEVAIATVMTHALTYAAKGWHVFPAMFGPEGEKKSHKAGEYSNGNNWGATTDEAEIRRDFGRWPDAIGIVTGAISGIFVVEADTIEGHGVDGIASLQELEAKHGALPATLMGGTPTGSIHRYFKHPARRQRDQGPYTQAWRRHRREGRWRHGNCATVAATRHGSIQMAQQQSDCRRARLANRDGQEQ
jgi:Bifunctional DNA primase/polymerase, N-terminal